MTPWPRLESNFEIRHGDCLAVLRELAAGSIDCVVTSPPYWGLRNYRVSGQLGIEKTPEEYVTRLVEIFGEVRRVLKREGTLWLNLGDSYATGAGATTAAGGKHFGKVNKIVDSGYFPVQQPNRMPIPGLPATNLVGIPWRVALALQASGWILRSDIIWNKTNCLPESVKNRPTKSHEYLFLFVVARKYFYDADAIREPHAPDSLRRTKRKYVYKHKPPGQKEHTLLPDSFCHAKGKNKRSVWSVSTKSFKGHFATFPPKLIEPCILAGCPAGGVVLDPFAGSGTAGAVALLHGRRFIGIELNAEYVTLAERRIKETLGGTI